MSDGELSKIEWRSCAEVCGKGGGMNLFYDDINPSDIRQGSLGDCWLLSAFACLANYPGAIQRVFHNKTINQYGKYKFKLFSRPLEKWIVVKIDDMIPCDAGTGQPLFARPSGDEAWVMLLEKAFAKYCGSYSALKGGDTLWALEALTGDHVFKFIKEDSSSGWKKFTLVHKPEEGKRAAYLSSSTAVQPLDNEAFFALIKEQCKKGSVLECSMGSGNDSADTEGIVHGHAYSLLNIVESKGLRLLQLRNPWGSFEWKGKWSDNDSSWSQNPKVAKACKWHASGKGQTNDGLFWMDWQDFMSYFSYVGFCFRTTGIDDLSLDSNEEKGCCGPVGGCFTGCFKFWCCCHGVKALCCAQATSADLDFSGKVAPVDKK